MSLVTVAFTTSFFGFSESAFSDPPGSVEFAAEGFSANENGAWARLVVVRHSLSGDPFAVSFSTINGTAQANVDYASTNGTIQFATGQTNAEIQIRILDDSLMEGLETFTVKLSNATGGATLGTRSSATVTIVDDESITPGKLDTVFSPNSGANGTIFGISEDDNEGVIIGGSFTLANGVARHGLARLKSDGSIDDAFANGLLYGETVYALARQVDGKLVIGGTFTTVSSVPRGRIARLLPNGSLDATFDPGTGADDVIRTISLQPDGKIVVGGLFSAINGTPRYRCARLNTDGTLDPGFQADAERPVTCSLVQPDGKVVIGGGFTTVNGVGRIYVARLNVDGSVDQSFNPAGGNSVVNGTGVKAMALQGDGNLIIGSDCSIMYGSGRIAINRLLINGDLDRTFNPNVPSGSSVLSLAAQPDGKVLVGGNFARLANPSCCALYDRKGIARLNSDGSVDTSFDVGTGADPAYVTALHLRSDFKVLLGGAYTSYNGVSRGGIARVHGDTRARITDWNYRGGLQLSVASQPGKTYVIEASSNMITWIPMATNVASASSFSFRDTNTSSLGACLYRVREVGAP
jgi:uncharacterized delta-60 repeat protein